MINEIQAIINNTLSEADFNAMKHIIQILKMNKQLSRFPHKLGIKQGSIESLLKSEKGSRIDYNSVTIPTLRYIYENAEEIAKIVGSNDSNSLLSRIINEKQFQTDAASSDERFMRRYFGIENFSETVPSSVYGSYFGYRLSSKSRSNKVVVIRYYHEMWNMDNGLFSKFLNIYNSEIFGLRKTYGHLMSLDNRCYLSGLSTRVGNKTAIIRKNFIFRKISKDPILLRGAVSTVTNNDEQIICRTILIPIDDHENVEQMRNYKPIHDDEERIPHTKIRMNGKDKNLSEITGRFGLEEIYEYLPQGYREKEGGGILSLIDNTLEGEVFTLLK